MTSCAAAAPTSGCEPAPRPCVTCVPIWMMRSAFDIVSACASVLATTKSTPWSPALIMLLTALPPAPPTPKTVIRGFNSRMSGIFKLMLMACLFSARAGSTAECRRPGRGQFVMPNVPLSEALAKPSSDPSDVAAGPCRGLPHVTRFVVFVMCRLGIDEKSRRGGEGRPFGGFGQTRNAERTADPDRPAQDLDREFRQSGGLAGAPGQDPRATRPGGERGGGEPVAH